MKVGIYDSYIETMGGGEKHMGAIARFFSQKKGASVDILTENTVDLAELSRKLNLRLDQTNLVSIHEAGKTIEELSEGYDLFINSTYWSTIRPRAKKNAALIFFPVIPRSQFLARSNTFKALLDWLGRKRIVSVGA